MIENYLNVLEDSLQKKVTVLNEIAEQNCKQEELLKQEKLDLEAFDIIVEKKDELIQKILKLDEGFETLYERVREQLQANKDAYKTQIAHMQQLISQITDKNMSVQAQEARNKKMVEDYFAKEKSAIRAGRQASKAAYDYYKNMNNTNQVPPQFLDQKH